MTELGDVALRERPGSRALVGRTTTEQIPAPDLRRRAEDSMFSDFLNLFLFDAKNQSARVIRALQNKGLFQSLAEPNLIAENGKEASFLAGGEYPVSRRAGRRAANSRHHPVQGVRRPAELHADRSSATTCVKLKVRPEVSSLDFSNAVDARRLPRAGDLDAPHRDRSRAAGRPDVRDRRADEQHDDVARCRRFPASATSRSSACCSAARRRRRTRPSWSS